MTVYSYEEALSESQRYFDNDDLAAKVFVDKYALRNKEGEILEKTPEDMHWRIAGELARIEKKKFKSPLSKQEIFEYLDHFKRIVPQGSPMFGIGNPYQYVSLANCFLVESPEDSYGGILKTDEQLVQIAKRRGGAGMDISKLRPSETKTTNAAGSSTGIIPFMERYSNSIREVGQSGRRGALLISLNVHHPEILNFIRVKRDLTKITGANLSIKLTDEFLLAVEKDTTYQQRWPVDSDNPQISQDIKAKDVWDAIIENVHLMSEPGLLFWDTITRTTPSDCYNDYKSSGVNPCAELILETLGSCKLLLLNLFTYVDNPFTTESKFNFDSFYQDCKIAQRLQDDIIDLELEAIQKIIKKIEEDPESLDVKDRELSMWKTIKIKARSGRRTGTGITALGDTLAGLGLKYGSKKSIDITEKIYKSLKLACYESSVDMAEELGAFTGWEYSREKNHPFLLQIKEDDSKLYSRMKKYGRRNVAILTTAPAGSVSILCQTTSGIEPVYQLQYKRRKKHTPNDKDFRVDFIDQTGDKWMEFDVQHPKLKQWMEISGHTNINESPWVCSSDVKWQDRIKIQAVAQKHNCHSISSTINLSADTTKEEIDKIYRAAWKADLKGITIYRQGSRDGVLIDSTHKEDKNKRPRELKCNVHHTTVKGQKYFVLVGLWSDGTPYEIFAGKNGFLPSGVESGTIVRKRKNFYKAIFNDKDETELSPITATMSDNEEMLSRMISMALRSGTNMHLVVDQLEKIGGDDLQGFAKCIARVLKGYIPDNSAIEGEVCPECGSPVVRMGGCPQCQSCTWSRCN